MLTQETLKKNKSLHEKSWRHRLGFSDVFSEGYSLLQTNFKTILLLVLIVNTPINLFRVLFPVKSYPERFVSLLIIGVDWTENILALFVVIGIAFIVEKSIYQENLTLRDVLKFSVSRFKDVFLMNIRLFFTVLLLTLLLVVHGIIWGVYYSFTTYITSLRGIKGKDALQYSKKLISNHWWELFRVGLTFSLFSTLFYLPFFYAAKKVPENLFISSFFPHTVVDICSAIVTFFLVILFLSYEYVKNLEKEIRRNKK